MIRPLVLFVLFVLLLESTAIAQDAKLIQVIARDAALRGLSVALVERRDFASGTSSRSSKLSRRKPA